MDDTGPDRVAGDVRLGVEAGALMFRPGDPRGDALEAGLHLPNPDHAGWLMRRRLGKRVGPEPERTVSPCVRADGGPWEGGWLIPRAVKLPGWPHDRTVYDEAEALEMQGEPRWYQAEAVAACNEAGGGVVVAPCGAGKSWVGNGLIEAHATNALILVHSTDLMDQWAGHIRKRFGIEPARVGGGRKDAPGRVTIAMCQTLARWSWWEVYQWARNAGFGLLLVDEAHHYAAQTFSRIVMGIPARVRVFLTATPERPDGLTPFLWWHAGEIVYRVPASVLEEEGHILVPEILTLEGSLCDGFDKLEAHERARALAEDPERNARIVEAAREMVVNEGRSGLIITHLKEHTAILAEMLSDVGAVAMTGDIDVKKREPYWEALRSGELKVAVCTKMADEALDVPRLSFLIRAKPEKNLGKVEQQIGRIARPCDGTPHPVVFDIRDSWGPYQGYYRKRRAMYRRRGWL